VAARVFTEAEIEKILLEHRYLLGADAVCKKWRITRGALRAWKAAHGSPRAGLRELVIVALVGGPIGDPAELVAWLDYQDHAVYSRREIGRVLAGLVKAGIAVKRADGYRYDRSHARRGRGFVF